MRRSLHRRIRGISAANVPLAVALAVAAVGCAAPPAHPTAVVGRSPASAPALLVDPAGPAAAGNPPLTAGPLAPPSTSAAASPHAVPAPSTVLPASPAATRPPAPASTQAASPVPPAPSTAPTPAPPAPAAAPAPAPTTPPAPSSPRANAGAASFAFESTNADGSPVRWNPCATIHYVTNLAEAPATAAGDVAQAVHLLAAATGMSFVNDGSTTELPRTNRPVDQASRYGSGHSPLLIAWVRRGETDVYNGEGTNAVGTALVTWIGAPSGASDQRAAYVTGQIGIEPDATKSFPSGFGNGRTIGLVLLHELGHVAGLAHVSDASQVMYPSISPQPSAQYNAGDSTGLGYLGTSAGCLPAR